MESRRRRNLQTTVRWLLYALLALLCAAAQTTPGFLAIGEAKPVFLLPLCLAVAVREGEYPGAFFGAGAGLLWDFTSGRVVGLLALSLLVLCFASAVLGRFMLARQLQQNMYLPNVEQFTVLPSVGLVLGAFLFSALLGIIFGLYPANKASNLQPVDALRTQ